MTEPRPTPSPRSLSAAAGERWGLATRAGTAVTVTGLVVLTALVLVGEFARRPPAAPVLLDVALGIAGLALVPALRARTLPVALGLAAAAAVSPLATPAATFALLHAARTGPVRRALAVAAAGIAAHLVRGLWRPEPALPLAWWAALVVATHAALLAWGALARARADVVVAYAERARRAEQDRDRAVREARTLERLRIAREMHDSLAHRLSLVATYAGALEARPDATPEERTAAAGVVREGVSRALDELRDVVGVLRRDGSSPATEPDGAAGSSPRATEDDADPTDPADHADPFVPADLDALDALVTEVRAAGQRVGVVRDGDVVAWDDPSPAGTAGPTRPAAVVSRAAYRVVQEGLTNARRHAPGQPVVVRVAGDRRSGLTVEVTTPLPHPVPDDSPRGPASHDAGRGGAGLAGLAERVGLAGGRLEHGAVEDAPAPVFRLYAWLPWQP